MSADLDLLPTRGVVEALLGAEERVLPAVRATIDAIARGADLAAERWRAGGRWLFVGAGTGGRLAWAQAAEVPGTFGLDRARVLARIAGGPDSTDDDEDDLRHAEQDLEQLRPGAGDVLIAVAASGSTPYTVAVAKAARAAGADVIAVVTRERSALAASATVVIEAVVGPEALRESSRLGAGTAQKLTLDALTTAAATRLGRVHGQFMIDVVAANAKLRRRVAGIVAEIAGCDQDAAEAALDACSGNARAAVLSIVGGLSPGRAQERAAATESLRQALAELAAEPRTLPSPH